MIHLFTIVEDKLIIIIRASTKLKISNLKQGAKLYLNEVHVFGTPSDEGKTFFNVPQHLGES